MLNRKMTQACLALLLQLMIIGSGRAGTPRVVKENARHAHSNPMSDRDAAEILGHLRQATTDGAVFAGTGETRVETGGPDRFTLGAPGSGTQIPCNATLPTDFCGHGTCAAGFCDCRAGFLNEREKPCSYQQHSRKRMFTLAAIPITASLGFPWFSLARGNPVFYALGAAKILTAAGCGLWWIADIVLLANGSLVDGNGAPLADDM
jgi:hypothetical protein